jgi:hypothetical protein
MTTFLTNFAEDENVVFIREYSKLSPYLQALYYDKYGCDPRISSLTHFILTWRYDWGYVPHLPLSMSPEQFADDFSLEDYCRREIKEKNAPCSGHFG